MGLHTFDQRHGPGLGLDAVKHATSPRSPSIRETLCGENMPRILDRLMILLSWASSAFPAVSPSPLVPPHDSHAEYLDIPRRHTTATQCTAVDKVVDHGALA